MFEELEASKLIDSDPEVYVIIYQLINTYTFDGYRKVLIEMNQDLIDRVNRFLTIQYNKRYRKIYNHVVSLKHLKDTIGLLHKCLCI